MSAASVLLLLLSCSSALANIRGVMVWVIRDPASVVANAPSSRSTQFTDTLGSIESWFEKLTRPAVGRPSA